MGWSSIILDQKYIIEAVRIPKSKLVAGNIGKFVLQHHLTCPYSLFERQNNPNISTSHLPPRKYLILAEVIMKLFIYDYTIITHF